MHPPRIDGWTMNRSRTPRADEHDRTPRRSLHGARLNNSHHREISAPAASAPSTRDQRARRETSGAMKPDEHQQRPRAATPGHSRSGLRGVDSSYSCSDCLRCADADGAASESVCGGSRHSQYAMVTSTTSGIRRNAGIAERLGNAPDRSQKKRSRGDEERGAHAPQVPLQTRRALESAGANHPPIALAGERARRARTSPADTPCAALTLPLDRRPEAAGADRERRHHGAR